MWARPALVLERLLICCSLVTHHAVLQCSTYVYVETMLVQMGGWVDFATILVQRFFSSFPHWATYKNRLDAVFGVEWVVFRDKPVIKLTYLALAGVGRARCFPPTCCLLRNSFLSNNALTFLEVTFDHPCEIL